MKTILVPLDGSPLAERALLYAAALAKELDGRLILMHAKPALARPLFDIEAVAREPRAQGLQVETQV